MSKEIKGFFGYVRAVLDGEILKTEFFLHYAPFFVCLVVLVIIYITNGYSVSYIDQTNRRYDKELKEIRSEFVSTERMLNSKSKYINIQDQIEQRGLGLRELHEPAYTISTNGN